MTYIDSLDRWRYLGYIVPMPVMLRTAGVLDRILIQAYYHHGARTLNVLPGGSDGLVAAFTV